MEQAGQLQREQTSKPSGQCRNHPVRPGRKAKGLDKRCRQPVDERRLGKRPIINGVREDPTILHHDIKSANVLLVLGSEGVLTAKIADFGLAEGVGATSLASSSAHPMGGTLQENR